MKCFLEACRFKDLHGQRWRNGTKRNKTTEHHSDRPVFYPMAVKFIQFRDEDFCRHLVDDWSIYTYVDIYIYMYIYTYIYIYTRNIYIYWFFCTEEKND